MKLPKKVDYLIVGGGLVGLRILQNLEKENHNAFLIEKSGNIGGSLLKENKKDLTLDSLVWTKENYDFFTYKNDFSEILTFGKKGLIPFVGFGDEKIECLEVLDSFTSPKTKITTHIKDSFFAYDESSKIALHSEITAIHKKEEDSKLYTLAEINGKSLVEAENIIWTASVQDLEPILPKDQDTFARLRAKIKKEKVFDVMTAQFTLSEEELGDHANKGFVFMGEESCPWLGVHLGEDRFVFISYYNKNLSGDHDFLRKHLKHLKRSLHKAFPAIYDENFIKTHQGERLVLHNAAISNFNPALKDLKLKALPNFFLFSSHKTFWPEPLESKLAALENILFGQSKDTNLKEGASRI